MAFYSGFFNSKGLDRTYMAEDFTGYLSSIICDGILDTYGQMFELTAASSGLVVRLGTGKAWIGGHYFINDARHTIDLTEYQDESLPRYVAIAIVCDTSEAVRDVYLEITPGTPAESPSLPSFPYDENKTRLLMYAVRLNVGATELSDHDWYDYREDKNVCGYCKCILGKCKVTELQSQLAQLIAEMDDYNQTINELINKVDQLEAEVEDIGDVVDAGQCGENVFYVRYSTGKVLLRGTGSMYDYDVNMNRSPFYRNDAVKTVVISNGITTVGEDAFEGCLNLETVSLPATLTSIGGGAFMPADEYMGAAGKLSSIIIPKSVTTIGGGAFWGATLESITIPHNVSDVGNYAFRECTFLKSVRYEGAVIGGYMFGGCTFLREFTIAKTVIKIGEHCFNYCNLLETIIYEGSIDDWNRIDKGTNWAGKSGQSVGLSGLKSIQCLDGYLEWDNETKEWKEVRD